MQIDKPPRESLVTLYHERDMSLREIADALDYSHTAVKNWMRDYYIPRRDRIEAARQAARADGPTVSINATGYAYINATVDGERKQIPVHRLAAVAEHGIEAVEGRVVHHRDLSKLNNDRENLVPMPNSEHSRLHAKLQAGTSKAVTDGGEDQ